MTELLLRSPLDMHIHLREGGMLKAIGRPSCSPLAGAVIMPNLRQPVDSLPRLLAYRDEIIEAVADTHFTPYMTLFFRKYSRQELIEAQPHIIGIKLYPAGITTGSEKGVHQIRDFESTLSAMEALDIPLLVHGETNGFVMDREEEFLSIYQWLASSFPRLHIVMEHITTAAAVKFVDRFSNVSATVTLHHLMITLDDLLGGLMQPHLFCKPVAKRPEDREALRQAVFAGHPRIMYGSDSAPHPLHAKECCGCAAGIFTAPHALPLLAQIFEEAGVLERLQGFVSDIACTRYKLRPQTNTNTETETETETNTNTNTKSTKTVRLIQETWRVPERYADVVPFMAGEELNWSMKTL